jgi:hypothetical protein
MPITIDGSGTITGASTLATTVASPTLTTPNINSAQFATVSGTAPIYPCRAWVNFNGTGTVAIRASGNVSSITDNGTGDYTVNFTTAMPDANYAIKTNIGYFVGSNSSTIVTINTDTGAVPTTTAFRLRCYADNSGTGDSNYVMCSIFR